MGKHGPENRKALLEHVAKKKTRDEKEANQVYRFKNVNLAKGGSYGKEKARGGSL
jgi:hypothetical protein